MALKVAIPNTQASTFTGGSVTGATTFDAAVNAADGDLQVKGGSLQSFILHIRNNGGTIEHRIVAEGGANGASNFASKITGASATLATTPQVAAGVDFTSGGGVRAAATEQFAFNTAAQTAADTALIAAVAYNTTNTALTVRPAIVSEDVNGVTRARLVLSFLNAASGAVFPLTAANISAGTGFHTQVFGFID